MAEELTRSRDQRQRALDRAREVKRIRRAMREDLKSGKIDAVKLVRGDTDHEATIERWRLRHLLKLVPGIGDTTLIEICAVGKFSPNQTVGSLPVDRRQQLARLVEQVSYKR